REIREAHVALPELGARQHADAAPARIAVPLAGEADLVDAVARGRGAERRLRALRGAAEEHVILGKHGRRPWQAAARVPRAGLTRHGSDAHARSRWPPTPRTGPPIPTTSRR